MTASNLTTPPGHQPCVLAPELELGATRTSHWWSELPGNWDRLNTRALYRSDNLWGIPTLPAARFEPARLVAYNSRPGITAAAAARPATPDGMPAGDPVAAVHFFLDDYRFETVWSKPERGLSRCRAVGAALTPDFSLWTDMPLVMQMWQVYRSRWCGAWLLHHGVPVIPTISWSTEQSYAFAFAGIQPGSVVAVSTVGTRRDPEARALFAAGFGEMVRRLRPATVLVYGTPPTGQATAGFDMKWPRAAAKSRAGNADALATITPVMFSTERGRPDLRVLRRALTGWAFNTKKRESVKPLEIERALKWIASNTLPVSRLEDVAMPRSALDMLSTKLDGKQAAAKTVTRKRAVLYNALDYAVELKALSANNLHEVKWTAPKTARAIDKRVVINKQQAKRLLNEVAAQKVEGQPLRSSGPRLKAFFAVMYYAALRPEEAAMLSKPDLQLPEEGWGELLLSRTAPTAGASWTDSGERRDRRQLKQRAVKEVRHVPSVPQLTQILHEHLREFGTAADGRLFRNLTGGDLAESTIARVWDKARLAPLTEEEYASPLARRPYDLRHACVSTWLAAGVPSTQCAEWAGHSVAVLHQIYAKVIAGL